eukprot:TRINITY_DN10476_c0_g1_i11.p5 TRINITY_DN10476_c0_g1~~TRINITY_DN10476_c0_g1_i11.p5  ORF type:complete len:117 (-),score=18.01 TRINITY_DN10476_c0_g1_i11:73-423(-)
MLEWDPQKRASAKEMLAHPWLNMPANYDTKMKEKDYKHMMLLQTLTGTESKETFVGDGKFVLADSMEEQSNADIEDNDDAATSEDDCTPINADKYGPNSPLLNIDHGPNPQFVNPE